MADEALVGALDRFFEQWRRDAETFERLAKDIARIREQDERRGRRDVQLRADLKALEKTVIENREALRNLETSMPEEVRIRVRDICRVWETIYSGVPQRLNALETDFTPDRRFQLKQIADGRLRADRLTSRERFLQYGVVIGGLCSAAVAILKTLGWI